MFRKWPTGAMLNKSGSMLLGRYLPEFLQAAVGARYGFDDSGLGTVRGLTIVPAAPVGLADRIGSLEPGKDADIVVISGHPCDPRNHVSRVWGDGEVAYDPEEDGRIF